MSGIARLRPEMAGEEEREGDLRSLTSDGRFLGGNTVMCAKCVARAEERRFYARMSNKCVSQV